MMRNVSYSIFPTAIGSCAIAWGQDGVVGIQIAEQNEGRTRARIARRFPGSGEATPPAAALERAIEGIVALLAGEPRDLGGIQLDMSAVPAFDRAVYELARSIPPGQVSSYGEIARQLGEPSAARAVGQALGANPFPIVVPCHRVIAAGGKIGGFSASGGTLTKRRLLDIEKARASDLPDLFDRPNLG